MCFCHYCPVYSLLYKKQSSVIKLLCVNLKIHLPLRKINDLFMMNRHFSITSAFDWKKIMEHVKLENIKPLEMRKLMVFYLTISFSNSILLSFFLKWSLLFWRKKHNKERAFKKLLKWIYWQLPVALNIKLCCLNCRGYHLSKYIFNQTTYIMKCM